MLAVMWEFHIIPHKTYVWGLVLSNDPGIQFVHVKADTACSVPKVSKTNNACFFFFLYIIYEGIYCRFQRWWSVAHVISDNSCVFLLIPVF